MEFLDSLILGVVQGISEFLPISSSGHLVLGEELLQLNVATLKSFDVVVHLGSLLAIIIYFWKDVWGLIKGFLGVVWWVISFKFLKKNLKSENSEEIKTYRWLVFLILIGTVPAVAVGLGLEDFIDSTFRNTVSVALWMIGIGLVFFLGERLYKKRFGGLKNNLVSSESSESLESLKSKNSEPIKKIEEIKWYQALLIGCAQALAIIPGISRSGSTIITSLFLGIERSLAARFSFLLGIPAIAGAGLIVMMRIIKDLGETGEVAGSTASHLGTPELGILLVGFLSSFVFGLLAIWFLMRFLKKNSLNIFGAYLVVLGSVVLLFELVL